jgi:hypothetical protein
MNSYRPSSIAARKSTSKLAHIGIGHRGNELALESVFAAMTGPGE